MREVHLGKVKEENKLQARDLDTILGNNIFSIYLKKIYIYFIDSDYNSVVRIYQYSVGYYDGDIQFQYLITY